MEEKLVSVETTTEYSMTNGKKETRIFIRLYKEALTAGLIADMGADNWQTLCVIALHMNEKGECYPTQDYIAKGLGVSRQSASARVKRLLEYKWHGRTLVTAVKERSPSGTWQNMRYTILPISQIAIFNGDVETLSSEADTD